MGSGFQVNKANLTAPHTSWIDASNSLVAIAGRDLNVLSTTSTQTSAQGSRTNINRVAGLYA